jgi:hypothetical protein
MHPRTAASRLSEVAGLRGGSEAEAIRHVGAVRHAVLVRDILVPGAAGVLAEALDENPHVAATSDALQGASELRRPHVLVPALCLRVARDLHEPPAPGDPLFR